MCRSGPAIGASTHTYAHTHTHARACICTNLHTRMHIFAYGGERDANKDGGRRAKCKRLIERDREQEVLELIALPSPLVADNRLRESDNANRHGVHYELFYNDSLSLSLVGTSLPVIHRQRELRRAENHRASPFNDTPINLRFHLTVHL